MPRTLTRLARHGTLAVVLVAAAACSAPTASFAPSAASPSPASPSAVASSGMAPSAPPRSSAAVDASTISITGFAFSPATLTVPVGKTVTWTNDEDSLHTVTSGTPASPSGLFDSGEIDTAVEFAFTFADPGTYPFFCARHDFMKGEITVTP